MSIRQTLYRFLLVTFVAGFLLPLRIQAHMSLPAGVLTYVPITLTNNQTTATPVNFQQMLTINWTIYNSQVNSGVTNVEFFDTSGAVLMAWCESNTSSGNTSSVVWVNLGANTISGSGGTLTIYMGFLRYRHKQHGEYRYICMGKISHGYRNLRRGTTTERTCSNITGTSPGHLYRAIGIPVKLGR